MPVMLFIWICNLVAFSKPQRSLGIPGENNVSPQLVLDRRVIVISCLVFSEVLFNNFKLDLLLWWIKQRFQTVPFTSLFHPKCFSNNCLLCWGESSDKRKPLLKFHLSSETRKLESLTIANPKSFKSKLSWQIYVQKSYCLCFELLAVGCRKNAKWSRWFLIVSFFPAHQVKCSLCLCREKN